MIFKMARDRTDDRGDIKRGAVIKDNNGRFITESQEVLRIWEANVKELLNGKGAASCLVRGGSGGDRTGRSGNSNAQYEKGKATGANEVRLATLEIAGELGVKWTGSLLNVCMEEGRISTEWRMCLIVPTWKRKEDVHDPGKYSGITLLSQVLKLLERGLDARIGRRVEYDFGGRPARFQEGERNSRRDVRPETYGREETGGTGQCVDLESF